MSSPVIPVGECQVLVGWQLAGYSRRFCIQYGVAPATPSVAVANAIHGFWGTRWTAPSMFNQFSQVNVMLVHQVSAGLRITYTSTAAAVAGTINTAIQPPQVTWVVRKITASGGRKGKGWMHLPSVSETGVDAGGDVLAASVTTYNARLALLLGDHSAAGYPMRLLSHDPAEGSKVITSLIMTPKVGTLRRRLVR